MSFFFIFRSIVSPFLSEEQLKQELTQSYNRVNIEITSITEIIDIDDRHKVVLFVTNEERYGKSFWQWNTLEREWQEVHFSVFETPELWMINKNNERSYRLIWHQSPDTKIKDYRFYLLKRRGYHVSQRNEESLRNVYEPQIQLEHTVALNKQTYGIMSLPDEWIRIIKLQKEATTPTNRGRTHSLFHSMNAFVIHFKALDHHYDEIPEAELTKDSSFARGGSGTQVLTYPTDYFMDELQ